MPISDNLKQKIDELEIERHVTEAAAEIERTVIEAVQKAGSVTHERRGDIDGWLDKATEAINSRTEGRYADQLAHVRGQIESGVGKLADQRPGPRVAPPIDEIETPPLD